MNPSASADSGSRSRRRHSAERTINRSKEERRKTASHRASQGATRRIDPPFQVRWAKVAEHRCGGDDQPRERPRRTAATPSVARQQSPRASYSVDGGPSAKAATNARAQRPMGCLANAPPQRVRQRRSRRDRRTARYRSTGSVDFVGGLEISPKRGIRCRCRSPQRRRSHAQVLKPASKAAVRGFLKGW